MARRMIDSFGPFKPASILLDVQVVVQPVMIKVNKVRECNVQAETNQSSISPFKSSSSAIAW